MTKDILQYANDETVEVNPSATYDIKEFERLRYQFYQCNHMLKAQEAKCAEHSNMEQALLKAKKEVAQLQGLLAQEKKTHLLETKSLLEEIKILTEVPNSDSVSFSNPLTEDKPEIAKKPHHSQQDCLIEKMLNVKLELANAQGEADWNELRLQRLKVERDLLQEQINGSNTEADRRLQNKEKDPPNDNCATDTRVAVGKAEYGDRPSGIRRMLSTVSNRILSFGEESKEHATPVSCHSVHHQQQTENLQIRRSSDTVVGQDIISTLAS